MCWKGGEGWEEAQSKGGSERLAMLPPPSRGQEADEMEGPGRRGRDEKQRNAPIASCPLIHSFIDYLAAFIIAWLPEQVMRHSSPTTAPSHLW